MQKKEKVLHIITVSFVINHFFGNQFLYLKEEFGNEDFKVEYSTDMSSIPKPAPKYNNNKNYRPR